MSLAPATCSAISRRSAPARLTMVGMASAPAAAPAAVPDFRNLRRDTDFSSIAVSRCPPSLGRQPNAARRAGPGWVRVLRRQSSEGSPIRPRLARGRRRKANVCTRDRDGSTRRVRFSVVAVTNVDLAAEHPVGVARVDEDDRQQDRRARRAGRRGSRPAPPPARS